VADLNDERVAGVDHERGAEGGEGGERVNAGKPAVGLEGVGGDDQGGVVDDNGAGQVGVKRRSQAEELTVGVQLGCGLGDRDRVVGERDRYVRPRRADVASGAPVFADGKLELQPEQGCGRGERREHRVVIKTLVNTGPRTDDRINAAGRDGFGDAGGDQELSIRGRSRESADIERSQGELLQTRCKHDSTLPRCGATPTSEALCSCERGVGK